MATVALPYSTFDNTYSMPRSSFKGDQESHVEQLIVASMSKQVLDHELRERALVPFFDGMADVSQFEPLQKRGPPSRKNSSQPVPSEQAHPHGLKRSVNDRSSSHLADGTSGSPPKKENQIQKAKHRRNKNGNGAPPTPGGPKSKSTHHQNKNAASAAADHASGAHSDGELSARSQNNNRKNNNGRPPKPPTTKSQQQSMMMFESALADNTPSKIAAAASAAGYGPSSKFAGPAFTNSPMPDTLPIPTTSLLMQEAADRLRSRLMLS